MRGSTLHSTKRGKDYAFFEVVKLALPSPHCVAIIDKAFVYQSGRDKQKGDGGSHFLFDS